MNKLVGNMQQHKLRAWEVGELKISALPSFSFGKNTGSYKSQSESLESVKLSTFEDLVTSTAPNSFLKKV
jgi:hypothetical protein